MYGHGCKLKRMLRPAVEAYLDERTCALAAQRAGIARSTLFRWRTLPEFRRMLDQVLAERFRLDQLPAPTAPGSPDPPNQCAVGSTGAAQAAARQVA